MAAIGANNVTYTVVSDGGGRPTRGLHKKLVIKVAFGDAALTYPSGGVPLTKGSMGCPTNVTACKIFDQAAATGILWKLDFVNLKLRGYIQGFVNTAAGALTLDDFALDTTADPLASAISVGLNSAAGVGTKYIGNLIELTTTQAPAAQTLYMEVEGW